MYHVIRPHERNAGKVLTLLLLFHLRVKRFNRTNVDHLGNIPSIDCDCTICMDCWDGEWSAGRDT